MKTVFPQLFNGITFTSEKSQYIGSFDYKLVNIEYKTVNSVKIAKRDLKSKKYFYKKNNLYCWFVSFSDDEITNNKCPKC